MLEGRVQHGVVGVGPARLVAPVKVAAISVKENTVNEEHHVDVDWEREWKQKHGQRTEELVYKFVGNHGKRAGVEKLVVVLMLLPEHLITMTQVMIIELPKVAEQEHHGERHGVVGQRPQAALSPRGVVAAVRLGEALGT